MATEFEDEELEDSGNGKLTGHEPELNILFQEALDGLRDDLEESKANVDMFYETLAKHKNGVEIYGTQYIEALRHKGETRDRQLKFLNMFKDRVTKKEQFTFNKESKVKTTEEFANEIDHGAINDLIEEKIKKIKDAG